jgi:hypothetical protein
MARPSRQPGPVRARASLRRWPVNWSFSSSMLCWTAWPASLRVPISSRAMVRLLARLFGGPQYSAPGRATIWRLMVSSCAWASRSSRSRAAASPRRRPRSAISYQRPEPVIFHPRQEGDQLPQGPHRDRRTDAVTAPGGDALVGPDDRVRPHRPGQPELRQRVAGDQALADGGVQRGP